MSLDGNGEFAGLDLSSPSAARVYDFWLGGANNFAVDREIGERIVEAVPQIPVAARANRSFLRRAVRWCVDFGIDQFLDLGSGIPTVGNVHEVAQADNPLARVAYVDNEPVAVAHSRNLLNGNERASITQADLRAVDQVLASDGVQSLLDFDRPIAVLMLMVLQYFPDTEQAADFVRRYRERMPPGSVFVLSHITDDDPVVDGSEATRLSESMATPSYTRTRDEFGALLGDVSLVEPGIVFAQQWHPDNPNDEPEHSCVYAAVAST